MGYPYEFISYFEGDSKPGNYFVELKHKQGMDVNNHTDVSKMLKSSRQELLEYLIKTTRNDKGFLDELLKTDKNL